MLLLAVLLVVAPSARAAEEAYAFDRLSIEHGLSQSTVQAILQDRDGFMWFGTMDGLNRFDGYTFIVFRHDPERPTTTLSDNDIRSLYEDRSGSIWVATAGGGICRYDKSTGEFTQFRHDPSGADGMAGGEVTAMFEDSRGSFWVGTGDGLSLYNPATGRFTRFRYSDGETSRRGMNGINCIYETGDGSVWFGTAAGLKKYDPAEGTFGKYDAPDNSLRNRNITSLMEIDSGELWVGTDNGLFLFNKRAGSVRRYTESDAGKSRLSGRSITFLRPDGGGGMWIGSQRGVDHYLPKLGGFERYPNGASGRGTWNHGGYTAMLRDEAGTIWLLSGDKTLYSFEPRAGSFVSYKSGISHRHRLAYNRVNCLYEDRSGTVWFGTAGGGLSKLSRGKLKFRMLGSRNTEVNELQNYSITSLAQSSDGRIWIGTAEDGLARFDPSSSNLSWYRSVPGGGVLSDDHVTAVVAGARGTLWIGTREGGLQRLETVFGSFRNYWYPVAGSAGTEKRQINALFRDSRNRLWIGTGAGVTRYDISRDNFQAYDLARKVPNTGGEFSVMTFFEDYSGTVWMGTSTGVLVRFDPVTQWVESYLIPGDTLLRRHNAITALHGESPDRIWVGTASGGLQTFDPSTGTFSPPPGKEKLRSSRINGLLADARGVIWLSTNVGLTRLNPDGGTVRDYDFSDGLQSNEFNRGAYCRLSDGSMLFGGVGGVNIFHPSSIRDNPNAPLVILTSFRKFDREVPVGSPADGRVPLVELSYNENFITFEFAAADYTAPERNQYAYFMEGFDAGWIYSGTQHMASYTNLDPGVYTFRFKGANSDGVWNDAGSSIVISIMPPFWRTSWFQFILVSLVVTAVYYGYRYKVNAIHTQAKTLEGLVEERTSELWDMTKELRAARDQLELRVSERTLELRNANETLRSEIIERIETQEELRRLKEFHENLVHTMAEGVSVVDLDGKITYCNPAAAALLGYTLDELVGRHWSVLVPSGSRDLVRAADERRKKGMADHYEIQMLRKDGTRVEVFVGGSPIHTGGVLMGTIAVFTDITGLKTAESRIKEQAALIDKARDVIIVTDVTGTITYWNSSAEATYGWTAAEAAGKNVHELLQDKGDHTSSDAGRIILEKAQWSGELHHTARDARIVIMQSRWTLVSDADGFPKSIMMINTDVTEKVKLEKQFLRAQRMESLGTLASGIAHDLNNVLSPIIMALQILRDKRTDERERTLLNTMELSAKRGSDIVKQVLMFARGAEGKHEELQIKHVIREMETIVRETFPKSIECRTDIPKDLWPVSGDPTQLHQVLLNLCVNARDAMMSDGGMLRLTAENVELDNYELQLQPERRSGPYIVVSVTDTGCGMSQDTMMKIFEPFFTTKGVGKGTGLGLSTVNGIIKGHGGFINVYSEPHVGSTFRIYLPAVPQRAAGKKPDESTSLPAGRGQTILLVDDEPAIRQIAKGTLETYGYRVLTAEDGEEAEEIYRRHIKDIALVITDMMMPVRDGKETIRILRKINPRLKIVVTSGLVTSEKENDGWHKHTQAFLAKPFTAEKLLKTLQDVLEVQRN